jgi:hypothetical protein
MIICKACNRGCRVVTVDFGIGAYEYWGAPGVDVQLAEVSDCCEADYEDIDFPEVPSWMDEPPPEEVEV